MRPVESQLFKPSLYRNMVAGPAPGSGVLKKSFTINPTRNLTQLAGKHHYTI